MGLTEEQPFELRRLWGRTGGVASLHPRLRTAEAFGLESCAIAVTELAGSVAALVSGLANNHS